MEREIKYRIKYDWENPALTEREIKYRIKYDWENPALMDREVKYRIYTEYNYRRLRIHYCKDMFLTLFLRDVELLITSSKT